MTVAVVAGAVLATTIMMLLWDGGPDASRSVISARVAMIIQLVEASPHRDDAMRIVEAARGHGMDVALVDGPPPPGRSDSIEHPVTRCADADLHVRALKRLLGGSESFATNLGTGQGASVREVLKAVAAQERRAQSFVAPRAERVIARLAMFLVRIAEWFIKNKWLTKNVPLIARLHAWAREQRHLRGVRRYGFAVGDSIELRPITR